ncbi:hypothetical protein [Streptomyces xanthophaeus]|uniref:hypothetical protein n=1 Tax=Streptomyces xanthophaeus TaxID=67385 RepID=UPI0026482F9C|nr:hypothetical protein [Streptomyces xanthophaeus]WKD33936.1 hypothetical protein KO717_19570 [Streptomyces xanthophaeus]
MPGSAARPAPLLRALPVVSAPAPAAWAGPVGPADGPADVGLAIGLSSAADGGSGWWLRSRYRRDTDGGDP